ncbi:Catalase [Halotydeus destructor]|nr:Catalase [Halotydeus destructor]
MDTLTKLAPSATTQQHSGQLKRWEDSDKNEPRFLTRVSGCPVVDKFGSLSVGRRGPLLLTDVQLIEELAHFNRERIPDRVVHAKGAGAFGHFEVTTDFMAKYCKASIFSEVGKKTSLASRMSTVVGESGSPDTTREHRGFALKFYTDEGNWDLVGLNLPIFHIRDPALFVGFSHSQKRNPETHLKDADMFWDFLSLREESIHMTFMTFSDRGIPDGYRHMDGFGCHAFKVINGQNEIHYVKFMWRTNQGVKTLSDEQAGYLAATDPEYAIRDMYNAIMDKNYPSWKFNVQVMSEEEASSLDFNPFDVTKVWPHDQFPEHEVGQIVFDRNHENYFTQVEQMAFSPGNMVPGIEASPDKILQARMFAYQDTQRYRLGKNFEFLEVNHVKCPFFPPTARDGYQMHKKDLKGTPNYVPCSFMNLYQEGKHSSPAYEVSGQVGRHDDGDEDNFRQVQVFWKKVLSEPEQQRLLDNVAKTLVHCDGRIQDRVVKWFSKVYPECGTRLQMSLKGVPSIVNRLLKPLSMMSTEEKSESDELTAR